MGTDTDAFHARGATGVLFQPLKWAFASMLLIIVLLALAWTIDGLMVTQAWPDGLDSLRQLLAADYARARSLASTVGIGPGYVTTTSNGLYALLFKVTGIHDMAQRFAQGAALSIPDTIVRNTFLALGQWVQIAMLGTQLLGVRIAMLGLVTPVFMLPYAFAMVDGWAQRAIRRACGGRESASLYHRGKRLQLVLATLVAAIVLLMPISLDPRWIVYPGALAFAVLANLQWAYYKKYL